MTGRLTRAALTGVTAAALLALAPHASAAGGPPSSSPADSSANRSAALRAASRPATLDTVARFFAAEGARDHNGPSSTAGSLAAAAAAADPRIEGDPVPVYTLSPEFVRGRTHTPVARLEYLASTAVAADGRKASLWAVPQGTSWRVVNIADGDDESRYAGQGARKLHGGLVFHEPQIDAWYVQKGKRVLPLDPDAVRAVGAGGTTVTAYRARVHKAYGDKLPGSAYARQGKAGGFRTGSAATVATATSSDPAGITPETGAAAAGVLGLGTVSLLLWRRRRPNVRVR